jgi:hypothetical protein
MKISIYKIELQFTKPENEKAVRAEAITQLTRLASLLSTGGDLIHAMEGPKSELVATVE